MQIIIYRFIEKNGQLSNKIEYLMSKELKCC